MKVIHANAFQETVSASFWFSLVRIYVRGKRMRYLLSNGDFGNSQCYCELFARYVAAYWKTLMASLSWKDSVMTRKSC